MDPRPRTNANPRKRRAPRHGSAGPCAATRVPPNRRAVKSVGPPYRRPLIVVAVVATLAADLPDDAGLRDLHERPVSRTDEPAPRVRLAEVAHRTEIDQVRGAV